MEISELKIKKFIEEFDYRAVSFNKKELREEGNKTPDFKVYKKDEFLFFCEVKEIKEDRRSFENGIEKDNTYGKLSNLIADSSCQFTSVNKEHKFPNVLAIYNNKLGADIQDYISTFTGNFYSDADESLPVFKNISNGKIKELKSIIDLCIWYDVRNQEFKYSFFRDSIHFRNLCKYFKICAENMKEYVI